MTSQDRLERGDLRWSTNPPPRVLFVDDQTGFPDGTAAANRLRHLAAGLVGEGLRATVLLTKPSELAHGERNRIIRGQSRGVDFEYTCGTTVRSRSFLRRRLDAFKGRLFAIARILQANTDQGACVVYLFTETPGLSLLLQMTARLFRIPVLVDACEWTPAISPGARARISYLKHARYRFSDGAVCISRFLVDKVRIHGARATIRLPITVDPDEFAAPMRRNTAEPESPFPYLLWCGQVDAYIDSIREILQAFALNCQEHPELVLCLVGPYGQRESERIASWNAEYHIPDSQVRLLGYVDRHVLCGLFADAVALLSPLQANIRSKARFPIKLGEYLMSGRPVIVGGIGDIETYFEDRVNALVYPAGDVAAMAERIAWAVENRALGDQIGVAGRSLAEREFDYRVLGRTLANFIAKVSHADGSTQK